jgi:hypothetical protein
MNRPLATKELCRKYNLIGPNDPAYKAAEDLARDRPDRGIFDLPEITCPYCSLEFKEEE